MFTTDSRHEFAIYPNLAPRLTLTGLNQLWVSDITYIRLNSEFIYLAVFSTPTRASDRLGAGAQR